MSACECKEVHAGPMGFICGPCAEGLRAALDQAEAERDEARRKAVWATGPVVWFVASPLGVLRRDAGRFFWERGEYGHLCTFGTEAEALAAGRALPWWT